MATKDKRTRYKNCPVCSAGFTSMDSLYSHFEKEHCSQKPNDMSVQQYYYFIKTGKMNGSCIICGKPTKWNEKTNKYHRFCENPKCKEEYKKVFEKRMIGKYGKVNLLNDPEQQRKMLANRQISGKYKWSDGTYKTYTGSYELDFLKMLDAFMEFDSQDVMTPSPHTYYYMYQGEQKMYIPDIYIPSLNLEIEIKTHENNHQKIKEIDGEKERLKDEVLQSIRNINYVKVVDKKYDEFFNCLLELKESFKEYNHVDMRKPMKEAYDDVDLWFDEETGMILEESSKPIQNACEEYKIPDHEISLSDGVYDDNGIWNSYILHKGKRYRYRVETIVFNEKNQIFAHLKGTECRLPGGSTEKDKDPMEQAECEVNEEARFKVKNLRDSGVSYRKMLTGHRPKYMSKLPWSYDGYYTKIYIAEYDGPYKQFVAEKDRDTNMYINGKFHDYKDILDKFNDSQRKVATEYLSEKMYGKDAPVTEAFIDMPDHVYLDYDRFVNGETNVIFVTGLPMAYNEPVAEKISMNSDYAMIVNIDRDARFNTPTGLKEFIKSQPTNKSLIIVGHKLSYIKSLESVIRDYPVIITKFPLGKELVDISHRQMNELGLKPNQYNHWIKTNKNRILELRTDLADYKSSVTKKTSKNKTHPVYVLLMHSGTMLANAIKAVTGNEFSHSSISFDSSMNSMFSFGRKYESNPFVAGLAREDIDKAFFKRPIPYALYVTFVDDDEFNTMKSNLFNHIKRGDELKYNFEGLIKYMVGMNPETKDKLFCSEFVATILNSKNTKSTLRPAMTKPSDLPFYDNMHFVTSGLLTDYDKNEVDRIVSKLQSR